MVVVSRSRDMQLPAHEPDVHVSVAFGELPYEFEFRLDGDFFGW